jgi:hypothetical protein
MASSSAPAITRSAQASDWSMRASAPATEPVRSVHATALVRTVTCGRPPARTASVISGSSDRAVTDSQASMARVGQVAGRGSPAAGGSRNGGVQVLGPSAPHCGQRTSLTCTDGVAGVIGPVGSNGAMRSWP